MRIGVISLATLCSVVVVHPAWAFDWEGKLHRDLRLLDSPATAERIGAVRRLQGYRREQVQRHLLKALRDDTVAVRIVAAEVAARMQLRRAAPVLVSWLSHWDERLRLAAAEHLGRVGGPAVLNTLIRALADPEPKVRLKVVDSLSTIGAKRAVLPLIGRVEDPHSDVRLHAIRALARLGDKRAVIPILSRLTDPSVKVRSSAVRALGTLRDPRTGDAITRMLRDHDRQVVQTAIETLGLLRYQGATAALVDIFQTAHYRHRDAAATALAAIGGNLALSSLIRALDNSSLEASARKALSGAPEQDPEHINRLLANPRTARKVALLAIDIARKARMKGSVPHLIEQLQLGRLSRVVIVKALGEIGDKRAQRPLLALLRHTNDSELQLAALHALTKIVDGRATAPLAACLESPDRRIRLRVIAYLGRLRSRTATAPLLRHLRRPDLSHAETHSAARSLATIGDPAATPTLLKLLQHADATLRRIAIAGIGYLPPKTETLRQVLAIARRSGGQRQQAAISTLGVLLRGKSDTETLAFLGELAKRGPKKQLRVVIGALGATLDGRATDILLALLDTVAESLKAAVIDALSHHRSPKARDRLIKALMEANVEVAAAAAWALARQRHPTIQAKLYTLVQRGPIPIRINATAALAAAIYPGNGSLLRRLLKDKNPYVRANAALGVGWLRDRSAAKGLMEMARRDRNPWVRINALRSLLNMRPQSKPSAGRPREPYERAPDMALEMAMQDADPRLRFLAKHLPLSRGVFRRPFGRSWIGLELSNNAPKNMRRSPFLLVTPSGLVRHATSGSHGEHWEHGLGSGECYVEPITRPRPQF